jgi:hypothetical protein
MADVNPKVSTDANPRVSIMVPPIDPYAPPQVRNTEQWATLNGRTGVIQRTLVKGDAGFQVDLHKVVVKLDDDGSEAIVPHVFLYF